MAFTYADLERVAMQTKDMTDMPSSLKVVPDQCPRCKTQRKYERTISPEYGCWSWWHQYVTLDHAWPERMVVGGGVT